MGILNKIIDTNYKKNGKKINPLMQDKARIFNTKTDFLDSNILDKDVDDIIVKFMNYLSDEIDITTPTKYKNIKNNKYRYNNSKNNNFKHPNCCNKDEDKNTFSATKIKNDKGEYYLTNPENVLERIIKIFTGYQNQIPIPDINQAAHIDLMKKEENQTIIEFVELKQWVNKPPLWAVAEVVKNLYMYIHFYKNLKENAVYFENVLENYKDTFKLYDISNIKQFELTILAPKNYYNVFKGKDIKKAYNTYKKFCSGFKNYIETDLENKLGKRFEIVFSTKYFDFSREEYNDLIGYRIDNANSIISKYLENNPNIKNKLKSKRHGEKKSDVNTTGNIWLTNNKDNKENYKYMLEPHKDKFTIWHDIEILFSSDNCPNLT